MTPFAVQVDQPSSFAVTKNDGSSVLMHPVQDAGGAFGTLADRPPPGQAGSVYYATDSPIPEWVDDGAAWRPRLGGVLGSEPPSLAAFNALFTVFNPGGGLAISEPAPGALLITGTNDGPDNHRGWATPIVSTTAAIEICLEDITVQAGSSGAFQLMGVGMRNAANAVAQVMYRFRRNGGSSGFEPATSSLNYLKWSNNSTILTQLERQFLTPNDSGFPTFLRYRRDATNAIGEVSRDRVIWQTVLSVPLSEFSTTPTHLIVSVFNVNMSSVRNMIKSLRVQP